MAGILGRAICQDTATDSIRKSQVDEELDSLHEEIARHDELVEALSRRLLPILNDRTGGNVGQIEAGSPERCLVPVASSIRSGRYTLERHTKQLAELLNNIEV